MVLEVDEDFTHRVNEAAKSIRDPADSINRGNLAWNIVKGY